MQKQTYTLYPTPIFFISFILFALLAVVVQPKLGDMYLLFDNGDLLLRGGYFIESIWVDNNVTAYKDYVVEYPPIGLYYYSLPRLFFNLTTEQQFVYAFVFIALFPTAAIFLLLLKRQPQLVLFLCTPSFFYYSICRYDIFPAMVSLIAILCIIDKKHILGAILLGLAIGIKWYPMVLVLPLLAMQEKKLKWLIVVSLSTVVFCFHHILWVGFDNVLATYTFHTGRGTNNESFLYLIIHYLNNDVLPNSMRQAFFIMQFLPSFVLAAYFYHHKIKPNQEIIALSAIFTIFCFILFGKFHSPQWLLWAIPFVILLGDKKIIWTYVSLDIINYIAIVPISDIYSKDNHVFDAFNLLRVLLTFALILMSAKMISHYSKSKLPTTNPIASNNTSKKSEGFKAND